MKLAPEKRGKLWFGIGLASLVFSGASVWVFLGDHEPADYKQIENGMLIEQVHEILGAGPPSPPWPKGNGIFHYALQEPSALVPGRTYQVEYREWRVVRKSIEPWTSREVWNHWMNQLGL